jgi:hypothetical protein
MDFNKGKMNKDAEALHISSVRRSTSSLIINKEGKYESRGLAFNKNGEIEQCLKPKKCANCTALNVVRNKKCFYCKCKL